MLDKSLTYTTVFHEAPYNQQPPIHLAFKERMKRTNTTTTPRNIRIRRKYQEFYNLIVTTYENAHSKFPEIVSK